VLQVSAGQARACLASNRRAQVSVPTVVPFVRTASGNVSAADTNGGLGGATHSAGEAKGTATYYFVTIEHSGERVRAWF
jgi:hypothetical protein